MIVVFQKEATEEELQNVVRQLKSIGFTTHVVQGTDRTIIGAVGDKARLMNLSPEAMPGVEKVIPILAPYKLASREFHPGDTQIKVGKLLIGGPELQIMAGPCAVESRVQILETAAQVKAAGATILRGGAFKPRSSPYSFQGMGEEGLKILAEAREKTGLPVVTEVTDTLHLDRAAYYSDILQIGSRNMQNFSLLRETAKKGKPILLKRGFAATIEEWILAAEYIMAAGNPQVILCERGIRTYETYTRNTLDLSAVPIIKHLTHLPIIVDPSHGTGKWRLVQPMAMAAVAAGADGLMIEVHPDPTQALSDGPQSLHPLKFEQLMRSIQPLARIIGRTLELPCPNTPLMGEVN